MEIEEINGTTRQWLFGHYHVKPIGKVRDTVFLAEPMALETGAWDDVRRSFCLFDVDADGVRSYPAVASWAGIWSPKRPDRIILRGLTSALISCNPSARAIARAFDRQDHGA